MLQLFVQLLGFEQLQLQLRRLTMPPAGVEGRLRVPARFTVIPLGDGAFRLHSLSFSLALEDQGRGMLAQLLDLFGQERTLQEVLDRFPVDRRPQVAEEVEHLREQGALELVRPDARMSAAERSRLAPQVAFFSHFVPPERDGADAFDLPRSGAEFQARLTDATVALIGLDVLGSAAARHLAVAGVGHLVLVDTGEAAPRGPGASAVAEDIRGLGFDTTVDVASPSATAESLADVLRGAACAVLTDDDVDPAAYERLDVAARETLTPWTSARLAGFEVQVGPTVVPGETACWACFEQRRRSNVPDIDEYDLVERHRRVGTVTAEALAVTPAAALVALEVVKLVTLFTAPATYGHLLTFDLVTTTTRLHPVLRLPRCPSCSRWAARPTIHVWQRRTEDEHAVAPAPR